MHLLFEGTVYINAGISINKKIYLLQLKGIFLEATVALFDSKAHNLC